MAPFEVIYGYPGTSQIMEAFDRRELDLSSRCGPNTVPHLYPGWIQEGRLVPLFYVTNPFDQAYLARLGHTGPLPSFLELPGLNLDQAQRARMDGLQATLLLSEVRRVFILPPGVPGEIRQYWQERFDRVMRDQRFINSVHNEGYGDSYGYGRADKLLDIIRRVQGLDRDVKDFLYGFLGLDVLDALLQ